MLHGREGGVDAVGEFKSVWKTDLASDEGRKD